MAGSESPFSDLEELAAATERQSAGESVLAATPAGSRPALARRGRRKLTSSAVIAGISVAVVLILLVAMVLLPGGGAQRRPQDSIVAHENALPQPSPSQSISRRAGRGPSDWSGGRPGQSPVDVKGSADVLAEATSAAAARRGVGAYAQTEVEDDASGSKHVAPQLVPGTLEWYGSDELVSTRRVGDAPLQEMHYGWMVGLLPYLGYQDHFDQFDFSKPWYEEPNLQLTARTIPELLNPADPRREYHGRHYGGLAVTHFVGISGVEDGRNVVAAKLPRSDPRAGIFGYENIATAEQIEDGAGHTLMMIGSGELVCPWVQSGGSTIRGARAPYFGELTGFGSVGGPGKGAVGVMADGSVRWIAADIDPQVFRELCTIAD